MGALVCVCDCCYDGFLSASNARYGNVFWPGTNDVAFSVGQDGLCIVYLGVL